MNQTVKHFSNLNDLWYGCIEYAMRYRTEIVSDDEMILQFGTRLQRHSQVSREFLVSFLSASFNDCRRDRHRRADQLAAQGRVTRATNSGRYMMDGERQRVRLLPNRKFFEIAHCARLQTNISRTSSIQFNPDELFTRAFLQVTFTPHGNSRFLRRTRPIYIE